MFSEETTRTYPVVLSAESLEETMRMKLPGGFEVDEMPHPVRESAAFGTYSSSCDVTEGYLSCRRSLAVRAGVIPVEGYREARAFFARANGAGEAPVVLAKGPRR